MNYFQKKKLAFMSIVNRIKGFIRTVSGVLPLTLEGCVDEESIIDYTLYGQSVQNGTPTPETPVDVESVGEKTINLINWDLILSDTDITKVENGYYSTMYFHNFASSHAITKQIKEVLKPNVTYTLSRKCDADYVDGATTGNIIIYGSNSTTIVQTGYWGTLKSVTFTLTQEQIDSIRGVYIYFSQGSVKECTISELQLTESDTVLPYEPFGYRVPIKVSGKNLFDMDNAMVSVDNWYYIGGSYSYGLNLEVGKQYRFSCDAINNPGGFNADICRKPKIADWSFTTLYRIVSNSSTTGKKSYTFVADGTECLWLYCDGGYKLDLYKEFITENIKNFQLEEGATATDYEPYHEPITTNIYLDEPLRKVGDYADYVDLENGKVVRNVEKYTFTGKETDQGGATNDPDSFGYVVKLSSLSLSNKKAGLCNCLRQGVVASSGTNRFAYHNIANHPFVYVFFKKTDFPELGTYSPSTAKQVVKEMYDSGVPMVLYYNRNTPTETSITLPNLPTFKGTNIISADTTVQPSNVEIEYYSNVKE